MNLYKIYEKKKKYFSDDNDYCDNWKVHTILENYYNENSFEFTEKNYLINKENDEEVYEYIKNNFKDCCWKDEECFDKYRDPDELSFKEKVIKNKGDYLENINDVLYRWKLVKEN